MPLTMSLDNPRVTTVAACVFLAAVAGMIGVGIWIVRRMNSRRIDDRGNPWQR